MLEFNLVFGDELKLEIGKVKFNCFYYFRLDAISCDAELQEKSEGDLKRLAQILVSGCEQAVEEASNDGVTPPGN